MKCLAKIVLLHDVESNRPFQILQMKLDILAMAAHPDDAELSCAGTLLIHKQLGQKIGILDLTRGELGSRGSIEIRAEESKHASEILQLDMRENLGFKDGFFANDEAHKMALIQKIRQYRPTIVLANAPSDRHPDHGRASQLIKESCFLSGLIKIETFLNGEAQQAWRPKKVFFYIQDMYLEPHFVIDISKVFEQKMESILAYGSQFFSKDGGPKTYISSDEYVNMIKYRHALMGKKIGASYGEGFVLGESHLGLHDFTNLCIPELV